MTTIDLKKELKELYTSSAKEVELIRLPKFNFVMIDGAGEPEGQDFQQAVQALYAVAFTTRFWFKFEKEIDYPVMALEGLWWMADNRPFDLKARADWRWTVMIVQPKIVTKTILQKTIAKAHEKNPLAPMERIRLESFAEGLSVQTLHVGPFATEPATIDRMHHFADELGFEFTGKHHEIYLSDPRRVKPAKMKTILRHPVRKKK